MIKFVAFVSIPKCASKTILNMMELGRNRDDDSTELINNYVIYENHQRLIVLEQKYNLNDMFVFTFVRNPYDRIISWYNYHKNIKPYCELSIDKWIEQGCNVHKGWIRQNQTNWKLEEKSPLLQYNFIESNTNRKIDYIGKMETFDEDIQKIIEHLNKIFETNNVEKRCTYKNIKKNANRGEKECLTQQSKNIIYNLFKKDFEYFGYEN